MLAVTTDQHFNCLHDGTAKSLLGVLITRGTELTMCCSGFYPPNNRAYSRKYQTLPCFTMVLWKYQIFENTVTSQAVTTDEVNEVHEYFKSIKEKVSL